MPRNPTEVATHGLEKISENYKPIMIKSRGGLVRELTIRGSFRKLRELSLKYLDAIEESHGKFRREFSLRDLFSISGEASNS
jgi:hypothetical protein